MCKKYITYLNDLRGRSEESIQTFIDNSTIKSHHGFKTLTVKPIIQNFHDGIISSIVLTVILMHTAFVLLKKIETSGFHVVMKHYFLCKKTADKIKAKLDDVSLDLLH